MDFGGGLLQMAQQRDPATGEADTQQPSYGTWTQSRDDAAIVRALSQPYQPADGGDGGGGGGGSDWGSHGLFGGAGLAPEDRKYFDAYGGAKMDDPRQVAAESGISLDQLQRGMLPRYGYNGIGYDYPSDKGGFFSMEALSGLGNRSVPGMATHQMNAPSTNNWRLLGMGPGWIMRNGSLINTQMAEMYRGGHHGSPAGVGRTAEDGMSADRFSLLGTGAAIGMPNRWIDALYWPGAATGGFAERWPSNTNV
jgi:hypothetical protein